MINSIRSFFGKLFKPSKDLDTVMSKAKNSSHLIHILEGIETKNSVELRKLEKKAHDLEVQKELETDFIMNGSKTPREKKLSLARVKMILQDIEHVDKQIDVLHKNLSLVKASKGKLNIIKAVKMAEVTERDVDSISLIFQEYLDKYNRVVESEIDTEQRLMDMLSDQSNKELADLENSLSDLKDNYEEPVELDFIEPHKSNVLSEEDKRALHELERAVLSDDGEHEVIRELEYE